MYLSNSEPIFGQKLELSPSELEPLATETFAAFHPYINIRDCGKKLWDEDQQKLVLAEGAVKVGETEPYLGWVLYTVVAIAALPSPPSDRDEVIDPSSHFFWTKPLNLTVDEIHERLMTTAGRGKLSVEISQTFGFGNKPVAPA